MYGKMLMSASLADIMLSIDSLADRGNITRNRAFSAWFAINFFYLDEDEALEAAASDGGNDQGIDIVFADDNAEEIVVIQAHCPDNTSKKTPKSKWDAVLSSVPFLKEPSRLIKSGRPDLAESISSIRESYPDYALSIGLITLGLKSIEIMDSVSAHQDDATNDLNYFYVAQEDIVQRYKTLVSSERGIAEDTLTFVGNHVEDRGDYGRAWIGSVSAQELQRLHKAHSDDLFAGNIRLFLGARKGGINEQIIKTAKSTPGSFWALNNGITIVADTVNVIDDQKQSSTLKLTRFSIVNGCQTTSSLVQAKASAKAKVLARIIAAKNTIKTDIVRYNNSQNAVKIWSVRAADDIQQALRAQFKAANIDYAPKQEGSRRKRDISIIDLDKVTQYLASSEYDYLTQAIGKKGELFDQPYQKLFYKGISATRIYMAWLVGNSADVERQEVLSTLVSDPNAGLLSVTSSYWIVYCTYKLLAKFSNIDSPQLTLARMASSEFQNSLKKYVSKAADLYFDAAVDTYDREDYGSFRSALRSAKFLQKMDGKLNARVGRLSARAVPDLLAASKSAKL